jgi:sulfoxide reductase heme-binding subunit YedZ
MPLSSKTVTVLKPFVFLLCLLPVGKLAMETFGIAGLSLGANPVEELIHRFGIWGLNFLLITLAVTPLRRLTGQAWLLRFRRMLGLFAQRFDVAAIIEDVIERPYITLGMTALLLLIPLAVTSTRGMMRRLGRRWQMLHRLVYVIAILGAWHFWWQVKKDISTALVYAAILALLLGFRLVWHWRKRVVSNRIAAA